MALVTATDLVEALQKEQARRGLNSEQLCRLLGIEGSTWSRIKSGEFHPTRKFLMAVMRRLPGLGLMVVDYMRSDAGEEKVNMDDAGC